MTEFDFNEDSKLGEGKDSITYVAYRNSNKIILKKLTRWGIMSLPLLRYILDQNIQSKHFYDVKIGNHVIWYDYEELRHLKDYEFLKYFEQICNLQIELLNHNILLWDLSYNIMINKDNELKLVDYGGCGFLIFKDRPHIPRISRKKPSLVNPTNELIQLQLIFHIAIEFLENTWFLKYSTRVQKAEYDYDHYKKLCLEIMKDTIFEEFTNLVFETNLLNIKGWEKLSEHTRKG